MRAWRERARLPVLSANAARDGQRYLWSTVEPQFLHAMWRTLDTAPPTAAPCGSVCEILADRAAALQRAARGPAAIEAQRSYRVLARSVASRYRLIHDGCPQ